MAPLWQLCERGDLEGVVEALAQVEEAVVEEALRKLTNVVVDIVVKDVEEKLKTVNQTLGMLNNLLETFGSIYP